MRHEVRWDILPGKLQDDLSTKKRGDTITFPRCFNHVRGLEPVTVKINKIVWSSKNSTWTIDGSIMTDDSFTLVFVQYHDDDTMDGGYIVEQK